ncbi:type VII secretion protein EccB [Micromonospora polyrhachis]|uniref:Type VII secretion protein EccB n=1 Tax=Micromonospora polyrhachis TaxID=1282883 RepID=A0A7W7SRV0_9ACTN|nr:type VII secretion protein EccB [Micromonospora polyrhachis]MBB4958530.1 type VII secretion protein EccB [Micromonospora polyrhachis]
MPSRQDQLHSYQFMVQRVVAALVMRETDPAQSPFRRAAGATLASVLIAAIVIGGLAVYGALAGGGSKSWRDAQAVIVEEESGARFVFVEGKLHPVLNYASALLIIKASAPKTVLVSRKSIEGVPRGMPLGIPGAPDSLPGPRRLTTTPWTICSLPGSSAATTPARSALLVGADAAGGTTLGDDALLGRHPDGSLHLIWHDRRHLIRDRDLVLPALTWASDQAVAVAPALLNALPVGADLARVAIPGQGDRSEKVPEAEVGEVFVVESQGGGRQYVVAKRDGLAAITEVQADLLLAAVNQDKPTPLAPGRFAGIPKLPTMVSTDPAAPPATQPRLLPVTDGAVCGRIPDDRGIAEIRVGARVPQLPEDGGTGARAPDGGALADHVVVPPGRGALVESAAAPGASGGAISVVTDLGRRHAVSAAEVLPMLGYGQTRPMRLPANLVTLVPAGKALDPEAARSPAVQE